MNKLQFLTGSWSGHTRVWRGADQWAALTQTEKATFKLDGLLLMIEGTGIDQASGKPSLQALGLISFDDASGLYRMRAFNDGRWLESTVELNESRRELHWGFTLEQIKTSSTLRVDDSGSWTETHQITIGSQPPHKFMEVTVNPTR